MKALLLTREYPPDVYGGAGVHVEYLSKELAKLIDAGLGVLQGLTEFLPVSSSGHLALAQMLIPGFEQPGVVFDATLHAGTACAVVWFERRTILDWIGSFEGRRLLIESLGFDEYYSAEDIAGAFEKTHYFGHEDSCLVEPVFTWIRRHRDHGPRHGLPLAARQGGQQGRHRGPGRRDVPDRHHDGPDRRHRCRPRVSLISLTVLFRRSKITGHLRGGAPTARVAVAPRRLRRRLRGGQN